MVIREMKENDKAQIVPLAVRLNRTDVVGVNDFTSFRRKQETLLNETLTDPSFTIYVAKEEEAVVGYIALREHMHYFTEEKQGYVAALVVASEHEGKNVGKRLLAKGEQWAKDHGYTYLKLEVFGANKRAISLYQKAGYQVETCSMIKELNRDGV
ncbi:GNAT family N-acetyltransferase [Shouchella clausii]|uniref:GNAT family N-acetyltransferase n=1 Tax=Shouchella clausii TaxID=79880 RepID=UPI000BA51C4E|nr:GNAT family N-acetyltransferase [Shouchella clausii]PAD47539.1 hypothetical protein CHI09_06610 [Shouchella clausii]